MGRAFGSRFPIFYGIAPTEPQSLTHFITISLFFKKSMATNIGFLYKKNIPKDA
jgi:hypothetical protein